MGSLTELLDRISTVQAYWDGDEGHKKYPKRKVIDLIKILEEKVPEIDWISVADDMDED